MKFRNTNPWLLALAALAIVSNVLSAVMGIAEGYATYIFIAGGGIIILVVLLT